MKSKILLLTAIILLGFAFNSFAQVPPYVPTSGLIVWYPYTGNANDGSGNGYNGTINGAVLTTDRNGNANSAYSFVSGNRITSSPNLPIGNNPRSFSVWFQTTSLSYNTGTGMDANVIFNYGIVGVSKWLGLETAVGYLHVNTYATGIGGSVFVSDGQWHNATYTFNGTNHKLYLDGNLIETGSYSLNTSLSNLVLGTRPAEPNWHNYNGKIDDLAFWDRELTLQEVTTLYTGCNLTFSSQPINQASNIGNNAQFTTASSDSMATYQWQTDLGVGFQNLNSVGQYSGTTNDTLTIANTTLSNNNQPFRCIISSGSCSDTSNVAVLTVNNNVGINETSKDNLFSVFPNPAQSVINVKADSKLIGEIYTIYDNTGKVVLTGKLNSQNTTIELGTLSGGIYMFSVGENMNQTFKVIKE